MKDSLNNKDEKKLLKLIAEVLDGNLDDEGRLSLNALLKESGAARRFYRQHMELHARLHLDYTGGISMKNMPPLDGEKREIVKSTSHAFQGSRMKQIILGLAACLVLFSTFSLLKRAEPTTEKASDPEEKSFATIKEVRSARWESGNLPTAAGTRLGEGTMRLSEGLATLQFDSGATLNLEAPAVLTLIDSMTVQLEKGTLLADIPESAIGFRITTQSADVVDFGTRFSVSVDAETEETRTQVYEGLVEVHSQSSDAFVSLKAGQRHSAESGILGEALDGLSEATLHQANPLTKPEPNRLRLESSKDAYTGRVAGHESEQLLYVKNGYHKNSPHRKAYLSFDLSQIDAHRIKEAELTLYLSPTGWGLASHVPDATFSVYGLLSPDSSWDEHSLTNENAPANILGKGAKLVNGQVSKLGSFMIEQGRQRGAFGISGDSLRKFIKERAGHEITLILVRDTVETEDAGLVHGFASRRHSTLPAPALLLHIEK